MVRGEQLMSVSCKVYCVLLSTILVTHSLASGASEYAPALKYNPSKHNKTTHVDTGLLHMNHYNADFDQSFYSVGLKTDRKLLGGSFKAEGFGLLQVEGDGSSTFSVKNLYYTNKMTRETSIDIGRKVADWSYDERFKPAAFWNNAWDYSKAFPELEGLFGAFVNFRPSKETKAFFFISPVSIPKWVSHYDFDDQGGINTKTPWFNLPPAQVTSAGTTYDTRYFLDADIAEIVLNPQVGFSLDYKSRAFESKKSGLFSKLSYLYGPDRDVDLAINFKLRPSDPSVPVDLTITPEVSNVHRVGTELGYKWSAKSQTIVSANFKLRDKELSTDDIDGEQSYIGLSSGGVFQVLHSQVMFRERVKMTTHFTENTKISSDANGELGPILLDSLSSPFRYKRGLGVNFDVQVGNKSHVSVYGYQDFISEGILGSLAYNLQYKKLNLRAGISFVEALSSKSTGFYKDYRENDSYHVGASYVF